MNPTRCFFHPKLITSALLDARTRLLFNKNKGSAGFMPPRPQSHMVINAGSLATRLGRKQELSLVPLCRRKAFRETASHIPKSLNPFSVVKINTVPRILQSSYSEGPVRQFQSYPGVPLTLSLCEMMSAPKQRAQLRFIGPGARLQVREILRPFPKLESTEK